MFFFSYITYTHIKKFIMAVGLLLVAAVFMSGCVTEAEDPIVGIWNNYASETVMVGVGVTSTSMVFNADGTGFSLTNFAGELASACVDFTWKNKGDGKYIVERSDLWYEIGVLPQVSEEFTLDGDKLTLALGEYSMEYHKQPASEYLVGLWVSDLSAYDGPENTVFLS